VLFRENEPLAIDEPFVGRQQAIKAAVEPCLPAGNRKIVSQGLGGGNSQPFFGRRDRAARRALSLR
ncbi:MAG TPA: hypothetical protein PK867_24895, partial [Pirellulales bacterium]|nr:hypothetical protein [Pirellulales bacterium]